MSERSALEETRSHLEYLKEQGGVVFAQEINSFPNTDSVFQRVSFIVAPEVDISPANVDGLNNFRDSLKLDRIPRHPSNQFYRTSGGDLRFGSWNYADLIGGERRGTHTCQTRITDPKVMQEAARCGVQFATVEEKVLAGPIRIVSIRPLPSLGLARLVAIYEEGFLNEGMGTPNEYLGLRVGLGAERIKAIEKGEFPFAEPDEIVHPYAKFSPSARANYLERVRNISRIIEWAENSERIFGRR